MFEVQKRTCQLFVIIFIVILILLITQQSCPQQNISQPQCRIYAITPTYARPVQEAELTRLSHIFMLLPNLHWIVVEDSDENSVLVKNMLIYAGVENRSTQLHIKTPDAYKLPPANSTQILSRGVVQRNLALAWLRSNVDPAQNSLVFFMDDDNTYSVELFREIAKIEPEHVGVWPVGLVGGLMVERPLLNIFKTKVTGFNAFWRPERPFPIDMAGFAIAIDLLFKYPLAYFSHKVPEGYQESEILRQITTREQLQPLANKCRDILVWHTRTRTPNLQNEKKTLK